MTQWYRDGDYDNFYASTIGILGEEVRSTSRGQEFYRTVRFCNIDQWAPAITVCLKYTNKGCFCLDLQSSLVYHNKLIALFNTWLKTSANPTGDPSGVKFYIYGIDKTYVQFIFPNQVNFQEFVHSIPDFNRDFGYEILSEEIVVEFNDMIQFIREHDRTDRYDHFGDRHHIPRLPSPYDQAKYEEYHNPGRDKSTALINLLVKHHDKGYLPGDDYRQFLILLTQGENLNQHEQQEGCRPDYYVVKYYNDPSLLEHLGYYHANFSSRHNGIFFESALDLARRKGMSGKFNIMIAIHTTVERPLPYKITFSSVEATTDSIKTTFGLRRKDESTAEEVLTTTLKPNSLLKPEEVNALVQLGMETFELPDDDACQSRLQKAILDDIFYSHNRIIEVIRLQRNNKIVGFTIFHIISTLGDDYIHVYCSLSMMKTLRKAGLMSVLGWRIPELVEKIFPGKGVSLFFLAAHFNSYRQVQDHQYLPMYKPKHWMDKLKQLAKIVAGDESTFHDDVLSCYVDKQVRVKGGGHPSESAGNFFERYFNENVVNRGEYKAAPVLVLMCKRTREWLHHLGRQLEFDTHQHIQDLSPHFQQFLMHNKILPIPSPVNQKSFIDSRHVFWFETPAYFADTADEHKKGNKAMAKL